MIDSGQPQGGVTLADLRGDKTRALEEYERLILIGPQRLVRGENDTDVPEGYYELGEGAPFPIEGAKDPDRVAVHVVELYDFEKMSLAREDEQPAYDDWPEAVQMGLQVLWPAPLLLPPLRQKVTRQPRQVDPERRAELAEQKAQATREQGAAETAEGSRKTGGEGEAEAQEAEGTSDAERAQRGTDSCSSTPGGTETTQEGHGDGECKTRTARVGATAWSSSLHGFIHGQPSQEPLPNQRDPGLDCPRKRGGCDGITAACVLLVILSDVSGQ